MLLCEKAAVSAAKILIVIAPHSLPCTTAGPLATACSCPSRPSLTWFSVFAVRHQIL